jgi:hypothetical protein
MAVAVLRLDRFTIGRAETGKPLTRHAALVAAVKDAFPGVIEVQLTNGGDQTWIGIGRWDSLASAQVAVADRRPGAAFPLARGLTVEFAAVGDA